MNNINTTVYASTQDVSGDTCWLYGCKNLVVGDSVFCSDACKKQDRLNEQEFDKARELEDACTCCQGGTGDYTCDECEDAADRLDSRECECCGGHNPSSYATCTICRTYE